MTKRINGFESIVGEGENAGFLFPTMFFYTLTHYHTVPYFDVLNIYSYGKNCE